MCDKPSRCFFYIHAPKIPRTKRNTMDYKNYIQLTLAQGVQFSIGKAIKDGFSYLGKSAGSYVGFTLVAIFIIIAAALFSMFIPFIGNLALSILVIPALMMGFAIYARKGDMNEQAQFEDFFDGFKRNYSQLILANLVIQLISTLMSLLFLTPLIAELAPLFTTMLENIQNPEDVAGIGEELIAVMLSNWWSVALAIVVSIVIQVLYLLANYFVVFYGFGFWEAMETSRQLMSKVFIKTIVLNIIVGFIMFIGIIATLGIGLLFLFPVSVLINFSVFNQVAGFAEGEVSLEDDLII